MRAMTERKLSKVSGVGSSRGLVAIITVKIDSKELHLLADR